jgi:chromosome segregation ATPase
MTDYQCDNCDCDEQTARIAELEAECERLRDERDRLRLEPTTLELDLLAECTKERDELRAMFDAYAGDKAKGELAELVTVKAERDEYRHTLAALREKFGAELDVDETRLEQYKARADRLAGVVAEQERDLAYYREKNAALPDEVDPAAEAPEPAPCEACAELRGEIEALTAWKDEKESELCARCGSTTGARNNALNLDFHCATCYREMYARAKRFGGDEFDEMEGDSSDYLDRRALSGTPDESD